MYKPDMVVHTFNSNICHRQVDYCEFEASLVYYIIGSSQPKLHSETLSPNNSNKNPN